MIGSTAGKIPLLTPSLKTVVGRGFSTSVSLLNIWLSHSHHGLFYRHCSFAFSIRLLTENSGASYLIYVSTFIIRMVLAWTALQMAYHHVLHHRESSSNMRYDQALTAWAGLSYYNIHCQSRTDFRGWAPMLCKHRPSKHLFCAVLSWILQRATCCRGSRARSPRTHIGKRFCVYLRNGWKQKVNNCRRRATQQPALGVFMRCWPAFSPFTNDTTITLVRKHW